MNIKIFVVAVLVTISGFAQRGRVNTQENEFLNRAFWKKKPSIAAIQKLVTEGHSLTEKNRHSMDPLCYAILEKSDFEVLKYILDTGININELTHDKRTYIFWAAYKDNLPLAKLLINRGAKMDIIDETGYSIIQFAAVTGNHNPKMYDLLIANGAKPKEADEKGRNLALLYAGRLQENLIFLDYLISKGVDINKIDNNGNNIFTYACLTKNQKVLEALINRGVSYKTKQNATQNPFTMVTRFSRGNRKSLSKSLLIYLEKLGFKPNFVDNKGNTALHNAAFFTKETDIFDYLITKGLDVNLKNEKGNTPFMNASYMNSEKVLTLLNKGVKNINEKNKKGETALTFALRRNKPEIVAYLINNGADVLLKDSKQHTYLYHLADAFFGKKLDNFKKKYDLLTNAGLTLDTNDNTILHVAAKKGNLVLLKELLTKNINVNTLNKEGLSPLHIAVMTAKKDITIIKELMNNGADKSLKTLMDETTYDLALQNELFKNKKIDISFLK